MSLLLLLNPKQYGAEEAAVIGGHYPPMPERKRKGKKKLTKRAFLPRVQAIITEELQQAIEEARKEQKEAERLDLLKNAKKRQDLRDLIAERLGYAKLVTTEEEFGQAAEAVRAANNTLPEFALEALKSIIEQPAVFMSALFRDAPNIPEPRQASLKEAIERGWITEEEYLALEALADA